MNIKKYLAEFFGTMVLVLFGCGTAVVTGGLTGGTDSGTLGVVAIALASTVAVGAGVGVGVSVYENTPENHIIVGMTIMYGHPVVLFKHDGGYAWKYKDEIKNLGNIPRERAIEKFEYNFNKMIK